MRLRALQPDNPILRAEIAYQRRNIPRGLQWFDRFGVVVVALGVSFVLLYLPAANNRYGIYMMADTKLVVILWVSQLAVILRGLFAGLNTMRHQHGRQALDILALTGISTRQMFIGKWWAALYQLRGWLLALGIIKLTALALMTLEVILYVYVRPLDAIIQNVDYYSHGPRPFLESALLQLPTSFPALPPLDRMIIMGVFTILIVTLEVMASTAVGIVCAFIPQRVAGLVTAFILRFAPIIIFTFLPDYPAASRISMSSILMRWQQYTWFSLADGGTTAILRASLTSRGMRMGDAVTHTILLAFYAAIGMYLAYLLFAFVVSHILLRRRGLLPAWSK
ncbi:MAG: hypothetical protein LCI00_12075 [Chloroflexi bacterium]|nr:hypothetical protein [Chloroflexota bacterium]MCC6896255.1 hypothetical protein [Anaerolineae bacterium]